MSYTAKSKAVSASAIPTPVRQTLAAPQSRPPVMKHPHPNDPPPLFAWLSEHGRSALPALAALSLDEKVRVQNFAALKTVFEQQNARLLPAQMDFGLTELLDYAMFEPHGRPHAYTAAVLLNLCNTASNSNARAWIWHSAAMPIPPASAPRCRRICRPRWTVRLPLRQNMGYFDR